MKVPFLDLSREWKFFQKQLILEYKNFGREAYYVLGPSVEKFENEFARFCNYKYAAGVSSGLSALETALLAKGIGKNDEVITVANSAVATALAISNVGANPIFCDIGDDFLIDPSKIESLITNKTRAILPVHLFGKICDMKSVNTIAKKYNLAVIEDACQAHGANFRQASAKNIKAYSFYPTKNLGALGEGGMVVTNDKREAEFVRSYRDYGQAGRYNHVIKGNNYRIDGLQCRILGIKLKQLNKFIRQRRNIAKKYVNSLKKYPNIIVNEYDKDSAYHLFVIRVLGGLRDGLQAHLSQHGIQVLVHYPKTICQQSCYVGECKKSKLKLTDKFQDEILSLPCYGFLEPKEQDYVINQIQSYFNK